MRQVDDENEKRRQGSDVSFLPKRRGINHRVSYLMLPCLPKYHARQSIVDSVETTEMLTLTSRTTLPARSADTDDR